MWEQLPPEAHASIRALAARVEALEAMVQALHEHNRALQEQLHQTSRNASRPPSSDPPHSERPHRPGSMRRRGGQPGHPGPTRPLLPVEAVDEVVVITPEQGTYGQAP
jgi:transposase